jgi:hypothetical protein
MAAKKDGASAIPVRSVRFGWSTSMQVDAHDAAARSNAIDASDALRDLVDELSSARDLTSLYRTLLRRSAERRDAPSVAEMDVAWVIAGDDTRREPS